MVMPDGGDGDNADVLRVVKALLVLLRGLPVQPPAHLVARSGERPGASTSSPASIPAPTSPWSRGSSSAA
ncbi:MAG: hypothetical protein U0168_29195 [Nannocystaceae bacterium]